MPYAVSFYLKCKKSRPNARLLEIHIQENHDSFFKILAERQPMFQCYVSECELKFNNPCERKEHCITVHKFPKNFRYDETVHHKDKDPFKNHMEIDPPKETQQQKTKKIVHNLSKNQKCKTFTAIPKSSIPDNTNTVPANKQSDTPINSKSSLTFIPRQVQKSYSKLLTNNQNREKNVLETDNMMDLVESLPK
ncbi:uncharacterized protein LOC107264343 isoform X2 [Cephus cinctus]|uniref:Uncharacterized protein LOC107264343 isoform X2 n=1 Tax=Cephus cinctus TaxID=211228 RepID=A0AAJ7VY22_CEPCN|nr:uncharacterized protein LOC107264343 isoform X2 [Cephus cinctus]